MLLAGGNVASLAFLGLQCTASGFGCIVITPYLKKIVPNLDEGAYTNLLQEATVEAAGPYVLNEEILKQIKSGKKPSGEAGEIASTYMAAFYSAQLFPSILMAQYEERENQPAVTASALAEGNPDALRAIAAASLASVCAWCVHVELRTIPRYLNRTEQELRN